MLVKRSQLLPNGGNPDDSLYHDLGRRTRNALSEARKVGKMARTPAAAERWESLYYQMADDEPGGLVGALIARDTAQVLRLSVVYALTDGSRSIDVAHIEAAWSVWQYCRQSVAYIFGAATGNPIADKLLSAITDAGPDGLDTRGMDRVLAGHATRAERDAALEYLNRRGQICQWTEQTGGRPRQGAIARAFAEKAENAEEG